MRGVRAAFFLTFAVLGTVLPYAPVFFRDATLSSAQIGLAFAIWSAVQVFSPVLIAWLADSRVDPRRLVLLCSAGSGAALLALGVVGRDPVAVLAVWTAYCISAVPLLPLLDGIHFALQRQRLARGESVEAYHRVRVWGTIGFIVPSLLLFELLAYEMPVVGALMSGAAIAALAGLQSFLLPDPRAILSDNAAPIAESAASNAKARLPTLAAARALFQPNLLVLCAALFLGQMASTSYAAFYPVYLVDRVGLARQWVGMIAMIGVVGEAFIILACGWLVRQLGTRGVVVAGLAATVLRLTLLAISAHLAVAIATQTVHGMLVVALGVVPQPYLDRHAADDCRHSIQGVFVMLMGCGKVIGSLTAGLVAGGSVQAVFGYGAILCAIAATLTLVAFRETPEVRTETQVEPVPAETGFIAEPAVENEVVVQAFQPAPRS